MSTQGKRHSNSSVCVEKKGKMRFCQEPRCYSDCDRKRILNKKGLNFNFTKSLCQVANSRGDRYGNRPNPHLKTKQKPQ